MKDFLMWNKTARIILLLAKTLDISPQRALNIFYNSKTSQMFRMQQSGLYLMSDAYIVEDIIHELRNTQ
ncbi:MAG: DUF3791 domain-containing protein [Muribaculaceae bacterium]|nr:DUF3791 domain-containing protein [Muribaculaceae bacterium]